eukprot:5879689-Alexandrium_andersonii.AAC.1
MGMMLLGTGPGHFVCLDAGIARTARIAVIDRSIASEGGLCGSSCSRSSGGSSSSIGIGDRPPKDNELSLIHI